MTPDLIDVEPLRDAVLGLIEKGMSWSDAAGRCGWAKGRRFPNVGDTSRLQRRLGVRNNTVPRKAQKRISVTTAAHIARSLDLDFHEVGL